jgi:hypothetical protein
MLRTTLKCDLPVEIYHFPDEMHDQVEREKMEVFGGVRLVEVRVGGEGSRQGGNVGETDLGFWGSDRIVVGFEECQRKELA